MTPEKSSDKNCLRQGFKDPDFHRLRPRPKSLRVSDLVYKFLEDVASLNDERRQRNNARNNFQRAHVRKYNRQSRRPDGPITSDKILLQSRYQIPKKSRMDSNFREDRDAMKPLEKKSSSQFVKDYVKAVNKSKRRAERYVCKALAFGMDAGFLVPTADPEGNVLRVSSGLEVGMFGQQNMDCRLDEETIDRRIRDVGSCRRGKRLQNRKSDESDSNSKLNFGEKKRTCSPEPAKKSRGKSKGKKGSEESGDKLEANDSEESGSEKSSSGFTDEEKNGCKSKKFDSSAKPLSKKRRVTDPDESPNEDVEIAKNNDDE